MAQRKYFKYRINQLEDVYRSADGDIATLEDLEEELTHRSTQRARKLLGTVRQALELDAPPASAATSSEGFSSSLPEPVNQNTRTIQEPVIDDVPSIDWRNALEGYEPGRPDEDVVTKPIYNKPQDIIDTWTILEALSPQRYRRPNDLAVGGGSIAYLNEGREPWISGEKSRPSCNLYYVLYLGAIDLEKASEKLASIFNDKRVEAPAARGLAALGAVMLDKKGVPVHENGLVVSSFGWAYGRALLAKLDDLKSWERAERILKEGLERLIYREDEDGRIHPMGLGQAEAAFNWLVSNCEIPQSECLAPNFAVRLYQPFSKGKPEPPLLNSFFLEDLQRVKHTLNTDKCGKALSQYLGVVKPDIQYDVLEDKAHIENALQPKYMPVGRWPGKGRFPLVLLQQTAVNLAMRELKSSGLVSVNGPPGTGKTTLLRDIVAAVLVDRAKALCAFENPDDAFKHAGQIKLGSGFVHLYKLHESVRGYEMLVASTNNKAVENVSKELPLRDQIAEDIDGLNYFKTASDALSENGETWGLIAAVMGNSNNRRAFIQNAWWDGHTGLRNYLCSITGQEKKPVNENDEEVTPRIVEECNPPKSLAQAEIRWEAARQNFEYALERAGKARSLAQVGYECRKKASDLGREIEENRVRKKYHENEISTEQTRLRTLSGNYDISVEQLGQAVQREKRSKREKPGIFSRIFSRNVWRDWKSQHSVLVSRRADAENRHATLSEEMDAVKRSLSKHEDACKELKVREEGLRENRNSLLEKCEKLSPICGGKLVTEDLWAASHDEQQRFSPNFIDDINRLRDNVFVAAIKLHKAFIDASTKKMRQNMGAFVHCLNGGSLSQDKKDLLPHLWSTAFLMTPVMSTAFASVGRMLKAMPEESIGWLLIDEAGQATPQAAIGAIYRAKRVVSVGDPLQIEPVVELAPSIVEGAARHIGVDPYQWTAPDASVQTVADLANIYGATIPRDLSEIRIGVPLLVHRRCEDPMFSISNKIAYNGLMVYATVERPSEYTELFGKQTAWFDVKGSDIDKWCPEEGEVVCEMLLKACNYFKGDPDIFVITPFRNTAANMRQRMQSEAAVLEACGIGDPSAWIYNSIGTIHTFQGKEAKTVILLLGAPDQARSGARNWATSNVNLLNVAVSRAKQNFYIVGNKELWSHLGYMKDLSRYVR